MITRPFEVHVADSTLADLQLRLARTRWMPDRAMDWDAGTSPAYLRKLVAYWRRDYDWRAREALINRLHHFVAILGDETVHYVHERGIGDAPLPIILTHGYPDSFLRFSKLIPLLTHPRDPADAFDVVVPSLPGFGFSPPPTKPGAIFHVGDLWHELMTKHLGYERYGAHGGDWGATVTEHLGRSHARNVVGIHLTDVPFWHAFQKPHDASDAEKQFFADNEQFQMTEGAYAMIQGTRPHTLGDGLADSPVGLAAWLVEKFQRWSDCGGDIESTFTKDELLDNIMVYWSTGTITTSFLPYYDMVHAGIARWMLEKAKDLLAHSKVPAGFSIFPRDLVHPPREWAERFFHIQRWTEMPRGGHFAAMEEPDALAYEIREMFRPLR